MLKLSSGLKREINSHFVLDEDGIRRIVGVLQTRAATLAYKTAVVLVVHREDDRFYETTEIADVLNDANGSEHLIHSLSIQLRIADPNHALQPWERNWIVDVSYKASSKAPSIQINVNSEDKNWALLLADELEPQVRRTMVAEQISGLALLVSFAAVAAFGITFIKKIVPQLGVSSETAGLLEFFAWVALGALVLNVLGERPWWITRWAGPQSWFKWGEQSAVLSRCQERHKNIVWGVIVGFVVSVVSTLYMNFVLPTPAHAIEVRPPQSSASAP